MQKRGFDYYDDRPASRQNTQLLNDAERMNHFASLSFDCALLNIIPKIQKKFELEDEQTPHILITSAVCTAAKAIFALNPVVYLSDGVIDGSLETLYQRWGRGDLDNAGESIAVFNFRRLLDVVAYTLVEFEDLCIEMNTDTRLTFMDGVRQANIMHLIFQYELERRKLFLSNYERMDELRALRELSERMRDFVDKSMRDTSAQYKTFYSEKALGRGAYGEVYRAMDLTTAKNCAHKTSKDFEIGFGLDIPYIREFVILTRMRRANAVYVVELLGMGIEVEDDRFIIHHYMPMYESIDKTRQDTYVRMFQSKTSLCSMYQQLLQGLAFLHSHAIVHGDIKPGNILFDAKNRTVKLADFNLARRWFDKRFHDDYNGEFNDLGTIWYIPPEIIMQSSAHSIVLHSHVDIWSMGCVFIYLQTGEHWINMKTADACLRLIFAKLGVPKESPYLDTFADFKHVKYDYMLPGYVAVDDKYFNRTFEMDGVKDNMEDGKKLVRKMFAYNPAERPSAGECLLDRYFMGSTPKIEAL